MTQDNTIETMVETAEYAYASARNSLSWFFEKPMKTALIKAFEKGQLSHIDVTDSMVAKSEDAYECNQHTPIYLKSTAMKKALLAALKHASEVTNN